MALKLTARQRRYLRDHGTRASADASELSDELNIVPYLDVVVNLIMFLLMVISSVAFFTQVSTSLASHGDPHVGPAPQSLELSVTLADRGIVVADAHGLLAAGCETTRMGSDAITVPTRGDGYDWAALNGCATTLKRRFPAESRIIVSADPQVPFQDLLSAMDAIRVNGTDELFSDVVLSAGLR
ncbi:MAG: hypothetical protein GW913_01685 [Myxococcales bacterium]|nr:hypothetical protein [Myxococcales bacterium]